MASDSFDHQQGLTLIPNKIQVAATGRKKATLKINWKMKISQRLRWTLFGPSPEPGPKVLFKFVIVFGLRQN